MVNVAYLRTIVGLGFALALDGCKAAPPAGTPTTFLGCYELFAESEDVLIYHSSPDTIQLLPEPDSLMRAWGWDTNGYLAIASRHGANNPLDVYPLKLWAIIDHETIKVLRSDSFGGWSATLTRSDGEMLGEGGPTIDVVPSDMPVYDVRARPIECSPESGSV